MVRSENGVPEVAQCHPEMYETLLSEKVSTFQSMLAEAAGDTTLRVQDVFGSEKQNFRMRASFKMWREDADVHYVMYNKQEEGRGPPHQVLSYPMGSLQINALMPRLIDELTRVDELRFKINDVRFLTTTTGDALVSITYNRPIEEEIWAPAAVELARALSESSGSSSGDGGGAVKIVGRSRKIKIAIGGEETVSETLTVPNGRGECHYTQTEGAFTQPNAKVCEQMLGWAYEATKGSEGGDLCELYCGNGCFTVALAPNFRRVIATEMSKASVHLAEANLERNGIENVRVARLTAEEFSEAHAGTRRFHRLAEAGIALGANSGLQFTTLFVDPPRAGLDEQCRELARTFGKVVYISCNPETLARDVAALRKSHQVTKVAAFDQFPYTEHLECGVVLERRVH